MGLTQRLAPRSGTRPSIAQRLAAVSAYLQAAPLVLVFLGFLVFFMTGWPFDRWLLQGGLLAMNLASAALVACLVSSPWPGLRVFFQCAPLVWVGRVSYGIYLWHIVVFLMLGRLGLPLGWGYWPTAVGVTIALAALSYYLLERPVLRLKRRFERVASS